MLKRKRELLYRKALTRWERCKYCANRVLVGIHGCGPENRYLGRDWRCKVIGIESSRRYGIQDGHVCNEFQKNKEAP